MDYIISFQKGDKIMDLVTENEAMKDYISDIQTGFDKLKKEYKSLEEYTNQLHKVTDILKAENTELKQTLKDTSERLND